jgi:hypothetical protein
MFALLLLACEEEPVTEHPVPAYADVAQDSAVVWNGFRQTWGYNHRMNSFGDYVGPVACGDDGCEAELVHTAASGSGADTASWRTSHTLVHAPGVRFVQGMTRFVVDAPDAEGETHVMSAREVFPEDGAVQTVVLAGWDLWATQDADRLSALEVEVGEVEGGAFEVSLALGTDCDSVECDDDKLDRDVAYEVVVSWLAVASDHAHHAESASVSNTYAWEADGLADEIRLSDEWTEGNVAVPRTSAATALAFRRVSVVLDDDHHMAEWASELEEGHGGDFSVTLAFKQWNAGTYWHPLSYVEPGGADVAADVVRLSFADGCAAYATAEGELAWQANGGPAGADAVSSQRLWFGGCG